MIRPVGLLLAFTARLRRKARPYTFISLTVFGPDGDRAALIQWRTE